MIGKLHVPFRRFLKAHPDILYELAAIALVVSYVNAFPLWELIVRTFGHAGADVFPVLLIVLASVVIGWVVFLRMKQGRTVRLWACVFGGVAAVIAALMVDPMFPAKRIHVAEYGFLAWVVSRWLSFRLSGVALLATTVLVTAVLGSHDELIQGLYPGRTYGPRDIAVNAVSGLAGGFLVFAFSSAPSLNQSIDRWWSQLNPAEWLAAAILTIDWILLLLAMPAFRGGQVPLWALLPLAAGGFAWAIASDPGASRTHARYILRNVSPFMLATAIYPLGIHAFALALH